MNEKYDDNKTLDELLGDGEINLGDAFSDFDPFAEDATFEEGVDTEVAGTLSSNIPMGTSPLSITKDESDELDSEELSRMSGKEQSETSTLVSPVKAPAKQPSNVMEPDFNPLAAAIEKADEKNVRTKATGVLSKPPVFVYGAAKEDVTDKTLTFEQLRIAKREDFPELDEGKRVTWSMEYGTITKQVPKPKDTVIFKLKEEIEASKEFLDMLKKMKDKKDTLVCKVKPRITAQSKGVISIPSYKGIFTDLKAAEQSGKAIQIVPGQDGKVYEIRCTEAGRFVVPTTHVPELSEVSAGFFPALPRIPFSVISQVIGFFRYFMQDRERELEAMVQICWDRLEEQYRVIVPKQFVSKAHIDARLELLDEDRYFCVADVHSHNSMKAKFSDTDDKDEKMTQVYIVIGELNKFFPEIYTRISCGGKFYEIDPSVLIQDLSTDFPMEWTAQVETINEKSFDKRGTE